MKNMSLYATNIQIAVHNLQIGCIFIIEIKGVNIAAEINVMKAEEKNLHYMMEKNLQKVRDLNMLILLGMIKRFGSSLSAQNIVSMEFKKCQ